MFYSYSLFLFCMSCNLIKFFTFMNEKWFVESIVTLLHVTKTFK